MTNDCSDGRVLDVLDVTMPNSLPAIGNIADLVQGFGERHALPRSVLHDVQVSLDEVLSNIVRHGYTDKTQHEIRIRISIGKTQIVSEVVDDGTHFNPLLFDASKVDSPGTGRRPGGLGIYFVTQLMDDLSYERSGTSNRLVMRKNILRNGKP